MSNPINPENVFVVIAAYNESTVITQVLKSLLAYQYTIVLVDDGSEPTLSSLVKNLPVYYLHHAVNLGQGAALQTGIEFAISKKANYIITFDADGQHDAADISKLLIALVNKSCDVVLGSRFMKGSSHNMTPGRKSVLQIARFLNYLLTGLLLTDAHNGLRAMTADAAGSVQIKENRMAHATELLIQIKKRKLHYLEMPVNIVYTPYSKKKGQTVWSSFRIFFDILLFKIFK